MRTAHRMLTTLSLVTALSAACAQDDPGGQFPGGSDSSADAGDLGSEPDLATEVDAVSSSEDAGAAEVDAGAPPVDMGRQPLTDLPTTVGTDERPASIYFPTGYAGEPLPVVFLLHGLTHSDTIIESYFELRELVDERRFIYVLPNGTRNALGSRYWNATDACCGSAGDDTDDSGYLRGIIDELSQDYAVSGVWFMGHSNGGYMSYRMACDHADVVRGVLSLAGAANADAAECNPSQPVRIIQVHGTLDAVVLYNGGWSLTGTRYPGAEESAAIWADYNGCDETPADGDSLELTGDETERTVWSGCREGGDVELWTVRRSGHQPRFEDGFGGIFLDELMN